MTLILINILFCTIFFSLGRWFGFLESQEQFGKKMEYGEIVYRTEESGWIGSPDALEEIKSQVDAVNKRLILFCGKENPHPKP